MNFCAGAFFDHCVFPIKRTTASNYCAMVIPADVMVSGAASYRPLRSTISRIRFSGQNACGVKDALSGKVVPGIVGIPTLFAAAGDNRPVLFTVPQFLRHGRRGNDLLHPTLGVTIQAVSDMKTAPRSYRQKAPARSGERF